MDMGKVIAQNKKAYFNYAIEKTFEAGIVLLGTEVKSLRTTNCSIGESYAGFDKNMELFLYNCTIPAYKPAGQFNHAPLRPRKLLLHSNELKKLFGKVKTAGYTIAVTKVYWNDRNLVKVEIGLAIGKKQHDKRQDIKKRDLDRETRRLTRQKR